MAHLSGKQEFDRWDIQKWFGISESTIYRYSERGEKQARAVIILSKLLEELRTNRDFFVDNIPADTGNFIEQSFLRFEEIGGKPKDIALLNKYRGWIETRLKDLASGLSFEELLGLPNNGASNEQH